MRALNVVALAILGLASHANAGVNAEGQPVEVLGNDIPMDEPGTFWSQFSLCPLPCGDDAPSQWATYSSVEELSRCPEPMLFDFNIYSPVQDSHALRIRACSTTDGKSSDKNNKIDAPANDVFVAPHANQKRADTHSSATADASCLGKLNETQQALDLVRFNTAAAAHADHLLETLGALRKGLAREKDCNTSMVFAYTNGTVAGLYVGSAMVKSSVEPWVDHVIDNVKQNSHGGLVSQLCGGWREANRVLGLSVDATGNLTAVQKHLVAWAEGKCVAPATTGSPSTKLPQFALKEKSLPALLSNNNNNNTTHHSNGTVLPKSSSKKLRIRGDCTVQRVGAGQGCWDMASSCGVSLDDFKRYNAEGTCDHALQLDQRVCCSEGTLPDIRPKPDDRGICYTQYVAMGDNCSKYAAKWGLTNDDIDKFNDGKTWGWVGCKDLPAGINICLSEGKPPMPAAVANAVCGPTKPPQCEDGNPNCQPQQPEDGIDIKDMNPCPLNACCNIWGQCGVSGEFCIESEGPRGNPGTGPPGVNSCVSSCGQKIVNKEKPAFFRKVGYYESWNWDRPCLNKRISTIDRGEYDTIHWAFGLINPGTWTVSINDTFNQWEDFKQMSSFKRILSLGGWGYSTEPATYDLLRQAMLNRNVFSDNIVKFVQEEGLDGIDFDWEYPGATDIDGTPAGKPEDGINYYKFLATLAPKMKKIGKTLSIAAPASFWYLKAFPIAKMAKQVDYIVYMTYDLHGQWDAGNKWSSDGCPEGNCLRSHINHTETMSALAMITKAGVKTSQIVVGTASYGRSFKMAEVGCFEENCHFTGDRYHSNAAKGRCTDTAGYISNAEIAEIIGEGRATKQWYDKYLGADFLVYDDTEWVSYISEDKRQDLPGFWEVNDFAGTVNWAIDLQEYGSDDLFLFGEPIDDNVPPPIPDCPGSYDSLDAVPKDVDGYCKNYYMLQALRRDLSKALDDYDSLLKKGYESKFNTYADAVVQGGNKALEDFMYKHGDSYFTCDVGVYVECCDACLQDFGALADPKKFCRYCEGSCGDWTPGCSGEYCTGAPDGYKKLPMPCPPDYSLRMEDAPVYNYAFSSVWWTMRDDKKNQFYADLFTEKGIAQDKIRFQDVSHGADYCAPARRDDCIYQSHDYNFPVTSGYERKDIFNPESVVKESYDRLKKLLPALDHTIDLVHKKSFTGSVWDAVDAVSLTIQSVTAAVKSMNTIEDTVDKWNAEKVKGIILAFLTALFLFIPVAGEVIGAIAGLANIARIAALAGAVGNTALDIFNIVDDKDNLVMNIFALVLEPLSFLDVARMSKAANSRRLLSADDLKKLHKEPGGQLEKIEHIRTTCGLKKRSTLIEEANNYSSPPTTRAYDLDYNVEIWEEDF